MRVMLDINRLPVPDWGLRCPHCDTPLAGMSEHRCARCGKPFSIPVLLARVRPIPDLGLMCPQCEYLLTGLLDERCPECGSPFSTLTLLEEQLVPDFDDGPPVVVPEDAHVKKRSPWFTGRERPLPNWGLECAACGRPLVGAPADTCPHCGRPFDLNELVSHDEWVRLNECFPTGMPWASVSAALYQAEVPYLVFRNVASRELYTGVSLYAPTRLLVPAEFFFDALHCLSAARTPPIAGAADKWSCPDCEEQVPGNFEICWSCGAARPGSVTVWAALE